MLLVYGYPGVMLLPNDAPYGRVVLGVEARLGVSGGGAVVLPVT